MARCHRPSGGGILSATGPLHGVHLGPRRQGHRAGAPLLPRTVHPWAEGHGTLAARLPGREERPHAPCGVSVRMWTTWP